MFQCHYDHDRDTFIHSFTRAQFKEQWDTIVENLRQYFTNEQIRGVLLLFESAIRSQFSEQLRAAEAEVAQAMRDEDSDPEPKNPPQVADRVVEVEPGPDRPESPL